jgi:hypothetical protein
MSVVTRFLIVAAMLAPLTSVAQVDSKLVVDSLSKVVQLKVDSIPWKWKMDWGAGFSTVQLNNWSGGGQDAISVRLLHIGSLDYAHERFSWDNDLELGYGLSKLGSESFRKTDDRIIFATRGAYRLGDGLRATGFVDFRTQFAPGFNYDVRDTAGNFLKISNLMSPGYLTGALGVEWVPAEQVKVLAAPLSSRSTFVTDDDLIAQGIESGLGVYGLAPGQKAHTSLGAVVNLSVDWDVVTNVRWRVRGNGFMPYETPEQWVLTLENAFLMTVNEWLTVSWLTDIFYDQKVPITRDDGTVGPATQFRNQLNINIGWSFKNF